MPQSYSDEQLDQFSKRVTSKTVVVITGAAAGIGKATALRFGKYGANVVIGDLDIQGAEKTAAEITQLGGQATTLKVDVTNWDDQVSLFELAYSKYGQVNVVIANAGVTELGHFERYSTDARGRPAKPLTKTVDINLTGVIYTAHLGIFYFKKNAAPEALKSLVFLGSMASWQAIPRGPMYSASKHAVLGFARSLDKTNRAEGIRISIIHPFFAPTNIVPLPVKIALAGIPQTSVEKIAGAIFLSATDPDLETAGCPYLLPDHGDVYRLDQEDLKEGVYELINKRTKAAIAGITGLRLWVAAGRDLFRLLGRPILILVASVYLAKFGYQKYQSA